MDSRIRCSIACLMLFVAPAAIAQPTGSASESQEPIPRELAIALLNVGPSSGVRSDIRVGKAPDDIPVDLLPPGAQVLGSMTQFESSVIILVSKQQPDSAVAALESHLLALGWTSPPAPPVSRAQRGFVGPDFGRATYDRPDIVCRNNEYAMLSAAYRRTGGSIVRVTYNRGQQYSACRNRGAEAAMMRNPFEEAPIPTLRAPQGSMQRGSGEMSMSSGTSMTLSTRLSGRLSPAELVEHYDKQMREQGWTAVGSGNVEFLGARTYRKNDEKSNAWTAVLFAVTLPDNTEQDVVLRMSRRP